MKQFLTILLLNLVFGCASKKVVELSPIENEINLFIEANQEGYNQCKEYKKNMINSAYFEQSSSADSVDTYVFIKDETKALYFIENFNFSKLGNEVRAKEAAFYNTDKLCEIVKLPKTKLGGCDNIFDLLMFFKALTFGAKNYEWKKETNDKAISLTKKYVLYQLEGEPSLIEIAIAGTVYDNLGKNGFLKPKNKIQANKFVEEYKKWNELIGTEYKERIKGNNNCSDLMKFRDKERKVARDLKDKLMKIL